MKKIGIYYQGRQAGAKELADRLAPELVALGMEVWATTAWDGELSDEDLAGTDLLITVGGDGTVLHAARSLVPHPIPILGVKTGRLGFLAELSPSEALERLPEILKGGAGRVEERSMLRCTVEAGADPGDPAGACFDGLNDVVVGRAAIGRPVDLRVFIDDALLALFRADALIVASATGSTGYVLSAGGPILHPESTQMVVAPVAAHLSLAPPVVVPGEARVEAVLEGREEAVVSVDGQVNLRLQAGSRVHVTRSPHTARLLRLHPASDFYANLGRKLGLFATGSLEPLEGEAPDRC